MLTEIFIIGLLLLLNAFFALSEMAIVSASKPILKQEAKNGKKSAEIALHLSENSGRFLSTVQVGITLVGTLAGAYGGATIAEKLQDPLNQMALINPYGELVAVVLVVAGITYFSVVIGELIPKQVALHHSEKFAMAVARPMHILSGIFTPIVVLLEFSARCILNVMGLKERDDSVTELEVKAVLAEGVSSGAIEHEEHELIQRIIRLGDRDIKSIMTHRGDVTFIHIDDTLEEVKTKIREADHSRYPVMDKDSTDILGLVKTKEMMAKVTSGQDFKVSDYIQELLFLNENTSCLDALDIFRSKSLHIAAVVDEYGSFEGIFTIADLMEAIVGIIPSNYAQDEAPLIVKREDGSWLVDGLTPIDEIHLSIGLEDISSDADYQTLAGFVLSELKAAPEIGAHFEFSGHRFEIVDMDKHRIDRILIEKRG
jgi:putative hemolysin